MISNYFQKTKTNFFGIAQMLGLYAVFICMATSVQAQSSYCEPVQKTGNWFGVHVWTTTDVEAISNINHLNNSGNGGYNANAAYRNLTATQKVTQYAGLPFEIFTDYPSNYTDTKNNLGIWIDWNKDMDFNDAGELVHIDNQSTVLVSSQQITIPSTQAPGLYRIRVRYYYQSAMPLADIDPCDDAANVEGAILDFTLEILPAPSCWPVSNVALGSRTDTTATIVWTPNTNGGTAWDISWGPQGYSPGDGQEIGSLTGLNSPSATITNLTVDNVFDVYVRTNCGSGDQSVWELLNFKNGYCEPVQKTGNWFGVHVWTTTDVEDISNINHVNNSGNGGYNGNVAYRNLTATQKVTQYAGLPFEIFADYPSNYTDTKNRMDRLE